MPPSGVKACLKRGKNDANDADANCEAVTRPSMRFVPLKRRAAPTLSSQWTSTTGFPAHQLYGSISAWRRGIRNHQRVLQK